MRNLIHKAILNRHLCENSTNGTMKHPGRKIDPPVRLMIESDDVEREILPEPPKISRQADWKVLWRSIKIALPSRGRGARRGFLVNATVSPTLWLRFNAEYRQCQTCSSKNANPSAEEPE